MAGHIENFDFQALDRDFARDEKMTCGERNSRCFEHLENMYDPAKHIEGHSFPGIKGAHQI